MLRHEPSLHVVSLDFENTDKAKSNRRFGVALCVPGDRVDRVPSPSIRKTQMPSRCSLRRSSGSSLGEVHRLFRNHRRGRSTRMNLTQIHTVRNGELGADDWRTAADLPKHVLAVERVTGIEPVYSAWKAAVLPLYYTRDAPASCASVG